MPTFAQITMGTMRPTSTIPAVTMPMEMKVIALLLCVSAPDRIPTRADTTVLRVAASIRPRNQLPVSCFRLPPISLTPTKKRPSPPNMSTNISMGECLPFRAGQRYLRMARRAIKAARKRKANPTAMDIQSVRWMLREVANVCSLNTVWRWSA